MSEPLEVLRGIWRRQGQLDDDLGCETKSCKRMDDAGVGFDDFAAGSGTDLAEAWRARLEREGKLAQSGASVRDLVLGSSVSVPSD